MDGSEKPAIFVFTTTYYPFVGGAEVAIEEVMKRLSDRYRFFIITARLRPDLPEVEIRAEGTIYRIGSGVSRDKFWLPLLGTWKTVRLMRGTKPVLYWAVMVSYASAIPYLLRILRISNRIPILQTLQEGDSEAHIAEARFGMIRSAWRAALARTDRVQAISAYLGDLARRYGYVGRIDVIPNGVVVERFSREFPREDLLELQKMLGLGREDPLIITTSRLEAKNGIDTLIRAFALLSKEHIRGTPRLLILGNGSQRGVLVRLGRELGVEADIRFLGLVPQPLVPRYLALAHVFARPSRSEGLGNSFLEAMAAGVPVVGTPVGGIPDFLKDGENGLLVPVEDPEALARAIRRLLGNRRLVARLVKNGRTTAARFSWDVVTGRFTELFADCIEKAKLPRILFATGIYPPDIGGPATYTSLAIAELRSRGLRAYVVTYGPAGVSRRIPKGLRHLIYFALVLWRGISADVIFAQDPVPAGVPAMLAAKLLRKRFAIRVAGDYAWEQAVQRFGVTDSIDEFQGRRYRWQIELLRRLQYAVVRAADAVVTPSRYFQTLVGGWTERYDKVHLIYNGVDIPASAAVKHGTGSAIEERIIVSAGRLVPWKGFGTLIAVMPELPDWKLRIVGDGPGRDALEKEIRGLHLENRVRLLGALPRDELLAELRRASVFVLNTRFESFSYQLVEAMVLGVPVVATKAGNLSEIITDGKDGLLIAPDNREELVSAIRRFDEDHMFRRRVVIAAKAKARRFAIGRTIDALLALFS